MDKHFIDQGVSFPKFWDEEKAINALTTLSGEELREFFGCNNSTSFTRLLKPCFPNRPEKMSYNNYVLKLVSESVMEQISDTSLETISEIVVDDEYLRKHTNLSVMTAKAFLKTLTEEQVTRFNQLKSGLYD